MFGIYEKNAAGVVDRRECSVCHGDHCPYVVEEAHHGVCPHCFGTGLAPAAIFDSDERNEAQCPHCRGTGRV
jgi:DnaJ-class molecular chaperone